MNRLLSTFAVSLYVCLSLAAAPAPETASIDALVKKLHGQWRGGPCQGDFTFNADGTFELKHYTPAGHALSGKWSVRFDALPATLVLKCEKSEVEEYVGKTMERKLTALSDGKFEYRDGETGAGSAFERVKEEK
jgi:hypothetical protein